MRYREFPDFIYVWQAKALSDIGKIILSASNGFSRLISIMQ